MDDEVGANIGSSSNVCRVGCKEMPNIANLENKQHNPIFEVDELYNICKRAEQFLPIDAGDNIVQGERSGRLVPDMVMMESLARRCKGIVDAC